MIDEAKRDELHQRLLEERQRLEGIISHLGSVDTSSATFLEDETDSADQHPADDATETFEREKNLTLERTEEAELQAVNEALQKFENGTYGICERCGKPIDVRRLQAIPEARYDVNCQAIMERESQALARHHGL